MRKVLVIDTSIFCVLLEIPGKEYCGTDSDKWTKKRIDKKINDEKENKSTLILPFATIIETGNHIANSNRERRKYALLLAEIIRKCTNKEEPWAAFYEQSHIEANKWLEDLAEKWPDYVSEKISLGDFTIKQVADFYSEAGYEVEILTGDNQLKTYAPIQTPSIPRRKQR